MQQLFCDRIIVRIAIPLNACFLNEDHQTVAFGAGHFFLIDKTKYISSQDMSDEHI